MMFRIDWIEFTKVKDSPYTYGEFGRNKESSLEELDATLDAAIAHSVDMGPVPIGVWGAKGNLRFVVVEGEVFSRENDE